jgi:molybdopterin molybdotransferase
MGPAAQGLAASIGRDRVRVARRPRVALFSTGDELVMPGEVAPGGHEAGRHLQLQPLLPAQPAAAPGLRGADLGIVPDLRDATVQALQQAAAGNDVILTSGGVSVGEEDHIKPAVQQLGTLDLWQIAMKPGKPFAHGRIGDAHFIGLPGNPVSSFVTFLLLVRPFLLKLQGATRLAPPAIQLPGHFDWPRADKRREFLRARRNAQGGVELFPNQSSGVLTSTVWADGLVDVPAGQTIARGASVRFLPLAELLA